MTIRVRDLDGYDLILANEDLRLEDRMEWMAGSGQEFLQHCQSVWPFEYARVAYEYETGLPYCFWGVDASRATKVGNVWLAACNRAVPKAWALHRHLKHELGALRDLYPTLQCWADARNTTHHEWLTWLGFKNYGSRPYGPMGLPFKYFVLEE